ncbi:uncharacterized protein BXZ73DRAFT_78946 [Epithele typhae]|uniref:uncharacterized protein n=1 Tax=Epithele typhae TaxID=378194 RepID=UPI002008791B|nr:uncharacterized protein BXZ73DRAFT_78946 [Epithele typhae]KAH9925605.1 hypothetical protein BXZ73DRAFT_78946 [Epithele typhae]
MPSRNPSPEPSAERQSQFPTEEAQKSTGSGVIEISLADSVPKQPKPDDEFWLEDGNLTLIARNAVEFRVYKGPLIANSPVFRDMLSLPQPAPEHGHPNADPKSPGTLCHRCATYTPALVHVPDSPEDLRHFLRVLVPGRTPRVTPDDLSFHAVSACVRLGHKYEAEAVLQGALGYLKKYYVDSFDTWPRVDPPRPPAFEAAHAIGVVNLARLTGTDALLPAALMGCCMLGADELIRGFMLEGETGDGARREALADAADVGRCFAGRANLMQANTLATLSLFAQTLSEGCTRREVCGAVFLRLVDELRGHERVVCTLDWFKYWTDYIDGRDDDRRICAACYKMLQDREKVQHKDIWRRLPELMGVTVEGWAADGPAAADASATPAGQA